MFNDDAKMKFTVRGDVALMQDNWKPISAEEMVLKGNASYAEPTVLMKSSSFVRLDYSDISKGLTITNISIMLLSIASTWIWLVLLYQLVKIVKSIRENRVFERKNIKRIKRIGVVFLAFPILARLKDLLFSQAVAESLEIPGYTVIKEKGFWIFPSIISLEVLLGFLIMLLIFLLAQVFAYGMMLKTENDLTV
jgi:hypothetical protein